MPNFYDFRLKNQTNKIKRWEYSSPIKSKVDEDWQQKADESYKRISKKYAPKYSVRREV